MSYGGIKSSKYEAYYSEHIREIGDCLTGEEFKDNEIRKYIMLRSMKKIRENGGIRIDEEKIITAIVLERKTGNTLYLCVSGNYDGYEKVHKNSEEFNNFGSEIKSLLDIVESDIKLELGYVAYINSLGVYDRYKQFEYKGLIENIRLNEENVKDIAGGEATELYLGMDRAKLVLTRSMIREYKDFIEPEIGKEKVMTEEEIEDFKISARRVINKGSELGVYIAKHLMNVIDSDEKFNVKSGSIEILEMINKSIEELNNMPLKDIIEHGRRIEKSVITNNGVRLASKEEIENERAYIFERKTYVVKYKLYREACIVDWVLTGNKEGLSVIGGIPKGGISKFIAIHYGKLLDAVKSITASGVEQEEIFKLANEMGNKVVYPETAEVRNIMLIGDVAKAVKDSGEANSYTERAANDIIKKGKKSTRNEYNAVANEYVRQLSGQMGDGGVFSDSEDFRIIQGIDDEDREYLHKLKVLKGMCLNKKTEYGYMVLDTVLKYKKCSQKQLKVIRDTVMEIESSKKTEAFYDREDGLMEINDTSMIFTERECAAGNDKDNKECGIELPNINDIYNGFGTNIVSI